MSTRKNAIVVVYGDPKTGKDTDCVGSFPGAFFIGPPNAFLGGESFFGLTVAQKTVTTIPQALNAIRDLLSTGRAAKYTAVVVSDLSILAETRLEDVQDEEQVNPTGNQGKPNNFRAWQDSVRGINNLITRLGRELPCHLILNMHAVEPVEELGKKKAKSGGLHMPSAKGAKAVARSVDAVFHVEAAAANDQGEKLDLFGGKRSWNFLYRCGRDDDFYLSGSRIPNVPSVAPMNLGEIFRAAHLHAPIRNGGKLNAEQLAGLYEAASGALLEGKDRSTVLRKVISYGETLFEQRSLVRDVIARAELKALRPSAADEFGLDAEISE